MGSSYQGGFPALVKIDRNRIAHPSPKIGKFGFESLLAEIACHVSETLELDHDLIGPSAHGPIIHFHKGSRVRSLFLGKGSVTLPFSLQLLS